MMPLKKLIVGIALIAITPFAMAVQPEGLYVGEDVGRSTYRNNCKAISSAYTSCKDNDFSHQLSFGYKFNELNAAEISYYTAGQTTKKDAGNISDTIDDVEWQFSGIRYGIVNIGGETGRLLVFGRYGIVHWEAAEAYGAKRINASGNALLLGVGAKYYITQDIAIRVQYASHEVGNSTISWKGNVNFLSAGLTYHF